MFANVDWEIAELNRKLDLVLKFLGVDAEEGKPKGPFVVFYKDVEIFRSDHYQDCFAYVEQCQSGFSCKLLIETLDND